MLKLIFQTRESSCALIIRLALGFVMLAHGLQKVFGWFGGQGISGTIHTFTQNLGFALWVPILLMVIEFLGSIALILGFFTRVAAFGIGCSMAVCAYLYHIQNGFFINWFGNQKGEGIEYHILVLAICLSLLIQGGGSFSVDQRLTEQGLDGFVR